MNDRQRSFSRLALYYNMKTSSASFPLISIYFPNKQCDANLIQWLRNNSGPILISDTVEVIESLIAFLIATETRIVATAK